LVAPPLGLLSQGVSRSQARSSSVNKMKVCIDENANNFAPGWVCGSSLF
jgi:hypothetical protein